MTFAGRGALRFTPNPGGPNEGKCPYLRTSSLATNPFSISGTIALQNFVRIDSSTRTWMYFEVSLNDPALVQGNFTTGLLTGSGNMTGVLQVLKNGFGAFFFIPDKGTAYYNGTDAFYVEISGPRPT